MADKVGWRSVLAVLLVSILPPEATGGAKTCLPLSADKLDNAGFTRFSLWRTVLVAVIKSCHVHSEFGHLGLSSFLISGHHNRMARTAFTPHVWSPWHEVQAEVGTLPSAASRLAGIMVVAGGRIVEIGSPLCRASRAQ